MAVSLGIPLPLASSASSLHRYICVGKRSWNDDEHARHDGNCNSHFPLLWERNCTFYPEDLILNHHMPTMASRHFGHSYTTKIDVKVTSLMITPSPLNIKHKYLSLSQQLPFSQTNNNSRDNILRWRRVKTQGSAMSGSRCGGRGGLRWRKEGKREEGGENGSGLLRALFVMREALSTQPPADGVW